MSYILRLDEGARNSGQPGVRDADRLRKIAAAAGRNHSLGFCGWVGRMGEPERVACGGSPDEVYRYLVKLRLEKAVVRSAEAARTQFEHVLKVVANCARAEGWRVLD